MSHLFALTSCVAYNYNIHILRGTQSISKCNKNMTPQLQKILAKFVAEDPLSASFLAYSKPSLAKQVDNWQQVLPWITPHYAVKSNPIQPLVQDIIKKGVRLDCASKNEMKQAIELGANPAHIILSNSVKDFRDIEYAKQIGVKLTTADTIDELKKIQHANPKFLKSIQLTRNDPISYEVIAEPGRHFSQNSCYLFARIIGKRVKDHQTCYHLNSSLYHSFNCMLMDNVSFTNSHD